MFDIGNFVALNTHPRTTFIVTRIYNEDYMAVATFDSLDGFLEWEYKVKQKYFIYINLDKFDLPGMKYSTILENLIISGYFQKCRDGTLKFIFSEASKNGISPSFGLDVRLFGLSAVD